MSDAGRSSLASALIGSSLGRYRLERLLGEGGMGVVYAGRHQDLGKLAAVKILHDRHDGSEDVRARFLREGQAVSRIRHPNIVDVYDVGTEGGREYLVMELLEGEDLRSLLARESPLPQQRTADLLVPVVAAVAAAHDLGVVHRDLKPDNVFLCAARGSVSPKVLDFGISKVAEPDQAGSLTGTGALLGTPYYMSPEQAQSDRSIDARSDQYSLGVILYECVTGRRPIEEPALYRLIQRIVAGDFPPPRQVNPGITAVFEHVVLRAMARNPADRFPSTRALGLALLQFAGDRVRSNYAEELAHDAPAGLSTPVFPTPPEAPRLGTTLGESVHEREASRRAPGPKSRALPLALGAGLLGALGVLAAKLSGTTTVVPGEQPPSAQVASRAPSALPSVGPASSASASAPPPASSAEQAPPAASVPSLTSAAARVASPKPVVPKRGPRVDRPELAPR